MALALGKLLARAGAAPGASNAGRPGLGAADLLAEGPWLAAALGPLLPPIRSEIFGPQRFAKHGRSLGLTHAARRPAWAGASFFPRLRSNVRVLRAAYAALAAQTAAGDEPGPAGLWLLDNFHLIEAQLPAIHEGLPRSYFNRLPVLVAPPLAGLPRVYGLAWAFVAHTDSAFDDDLLVHYLCAYQETRELGLAELWALPTTLRVVLVENLRRLAERLATEQAVRDLANRCCDRIDRCSLVQLQGLAAQLALRGAAPVFMAQLGQRLQDRASGPAARMPVEIGLWLQQGLARRDQALATLAAGQAADNLSVSNAVNALRALNDADWPDIVARSSPVMGLMLGQALFAAEHPATRDVTLHGIEALARSSQRSERQVAQVLLGLMAGAGVPRSVDARAEAPAAGPAAGSAEAAEAAEAADPAADAWAGSGQGAAQTAGYWLQAAGRPALMRALGLHGWRPVWALWSQRLRRHALLPAYLATLLLASLGLALGLLPSAGLAGAQGALLLLLLLAPASELVVAVLHRLVSESARPQHLPRLALAAGVPPGHRVLVVVPALLNTPAAIDALAHRLRLHQLANPEPQAQFALLTDWADADTARADTDAALLAQAQACVAALNAPGQSQPLPDGSLRFVLLHRRRQYSASERRWIGWERKRGKLEQLVAELATPGLVGQAEASAFVGLGPLSCPAPGVRYLVTLDSDTQLPPGRLRDLVGVAAHPANRPVLAAGGERVVAGYGILQPRLVTPLPQPEEDTVYHRLFAGQSGIDPYSAASSEVYQDLFDEGSFSGKGLLDVQALHAVLAGRLPEGRVLSHDLLEGALARCAAVTDITLIEDAPFHADVAAARVHRWTRGDWQLLPLLLASLLPRRLHAAALPLGALNRWKLADNLRRSLVAPMSLLLLLLAVLGTALSPTVAVLVVAAAFSAGPWLGALAGAMPSRRGVAWRHFLHGVAGDLARAAGIAAWHLAMLLQHSLLAVDAIVRALWRAVFSQRWLLQWTTAAAAQAAMQAGWAASWRHNASVPLVAAVLAAALWWWPAQHLLAGLALCALWGLAPLWTWLASRPASAPRRGATTAADQALLHTLARDTWRYFERTVTAADHHLPPDNLQTWPREMLARRTSPTNIGLYLLATACAREFGWIDTAAMLQRLEATLQTLDSLARHRGHFYNWYDTASAQPLLPLYVSTVDSGNCSGHLLAVAQACLELAQAPAPDTPDAPLRQRLQQVAARCQRLAWAPEYGFLYHPRRHLLHIGWRAAEDQLDTSFYDLLASESRLTSLLAIAKGDVPVRHWAALGRPFQAVGVTAGLWSWSGSMFEYLMPSLVLAEPHGSVLRQAGCAAVLAQQAFAAGQGVPWGISESAYAGCDYTLAYQYAPQGVPRLALRRTPLDELVVAPYATALAAMLAPQAALANFGWLQRLGARGEYGYIEALDFSPARQTAGGTVTPVSTFMAHHQGMSIVALAQLLLAGAPQRWGGADPHIEAVASLLHERAPREISALRAPLPGPQPQARRRAAPSPLRTVLPGQNRVEPTQLMSNGRYSVALRANGAGHSRWGDIDVTRWRDDALRDACGHFFFVREQAAAAWLPLSAHPAPGVEAGLEAGMEAGVDHHAVFHADRVVLEARWPATGPFAGLHARITVWVSPEDDIEFRRVELQYDGPQPLALELASVFEPTLAPARADEAHPAFSQMFIGLRACAAQRALLFDRRPRLAGEPGACGAHFLAQSAPEVQGLLLQADRAAWTGRNRAPGQPRGALQPWPADGTAAGAGADAGDGHSDGAAALSCTPLDSGLDPVCALGMRLLLQPGRRVSLCFATAVAGDGATLQAVVDKHLQPSHIDRAALMSATLASVRLRDLRLGPETSIALQALSTALLLTLPRPQARDDAPRVCDRRLLWRFGISGDRALLLVSVSALPGLGMVRALSQALLYWSWGGVACDLVVVNAEAASYLMPLQHELLGLRDRFDAGAAGRSRQARCGWHLLRADDVSAEELQTLQTLARVRLLADGRSLAFHLQEWALGPPLLPARPHSVLVSLPVAPPGSPGSPDSPAPAVSANAASAPDPQASATRAAPSPAIARGEGRLRPGEVPGPAQPLRAAPHQADEPTPPVGRFAADARAAFQFSVGPTQRPARPWANVLANEDFGSLVTEAGGGNSWAVNSRMNQITPWSNDPVADPPGEWLLLQDLATRAVFSATPSAWAEPGATHSVEHGQGSTRMQHRRGSLVVSLCWCVDVHTAVRQLQVQVHNAGPHRRSLRLAAVCEWQLGAQRSDRASINTQRVVAEAATGAVAPAQAYPAASAGPVLLATQQDASGGVGQGTAFLCWAVAGTRSRVDASDWTCSRGECLDARGQPVLPDLFGQQQGAGLDPCAALGSRFNVEPGETVERTLLLGWAPQPAAALALARSATAQPAGARLQASHAAWDALLGATQVHTPDPLFDAQVNRWLLYQTVACRLWAKAGYYQAGGATGFRDQLQDAAALAWAEPGLLRTQILRCAARQFAEGDVQHWWHAPGGAGVRTHFSDDLLWLPWALALYLRRSGDTALLDAAAPFIEGQTIAPGAEDAYGTPAVSAQQASIWEHAARAIDRSLRVGVHGLPLMGSGDWNDGMNRVGHEGRGESVWLAWFLCQVVVDCLPLASARGDSARVQRWQQALAGWRTALAGPAWDGQWYTRAFFDDGQPLGAATRSEARIDLVAQAWAVLSGEAPPERQAQALAAADALLVDPVAGLVRLLHPPLATEQPSAGYIQAYPPGVRENGGQYSHAGVWALMAQARRAQNLAASDPVESRAAAARAWQYWLHLSPAHRAQQPNQAAVYRAEPYVMAGDVYTAAPWVGRGGWSWYTGAAGWMHRAALESFFGLQLQASGLCFTPALPPHWRHAAITLRRDGRSLHVLLLRASPGDALAAAGAQDAWAAVGGPAPGGGPGHVSTSAWPDLPTLLLPGQHLAWAGLADRARVVVPLEGAGGVI